MTKTTGQGLQLLKFINVLVAYSEVGKVLYITIILLQYMSDTDTVQTVP